MKRPSTLVYGVDETPPIPVTVLSALQHVGLVAIFLVYPLVVSREAGASVATSMSILSLAMLVLGVGTIIQALTRGPVGSGYLAPINFSAIYLGPSLVAAQLGGLALVFGMTVFAGLIETVLSRGLKYLRPFLPPEIAGLVVFFVGLSVGSVGVRYLLGTGAPEPVGAVHWAVTGVAFLTMISLNVWTRGMLRWFCALIGMAVGYGAAAAGGLLTAVEAGGVGGVPIIAVPRFDHLAWSFDVALVPLFTVAALAATVKVIGLLSTCQKTNDAEWVRPEMGSIGRGVLADGIGTTLAGAFGTIGINIGSSSIGMISATGIASRVIAYATGAMFIALAFLPAVTATLALMPRPVMAAALIFAACFMLVSGMQVITSRMLDVRKTLVIGIATVAALALGANPDLAAGVPGALRPLFSSPLVLGTVTAIGLNLVFRLGVRQTVTLSVNPLAPYAKEVEDFLNRQGAAWGARPDVVARAIFGINQSVEIVADHGNVDGPITVTASFDEFNLDIDLSYDGDMIELSDRRPSDAEIRDSEDGLRRLAGFMLTRNADRAQATRSDGRAAVAFHFDH